MKSQTHPYDREHLKEVLHRNELTDEIVALRDWAQKHLELVLAGVLLVAALAFGAYFFVDSQKKRELAASLLLNEAQQLFVRASSAPASQAAGAYGQAYLKYQSLVGTYPNSVEFRAAELGMADVDLALGKGADAEKAYAELDSRRAEDPIAALAALGRARALELEGKSPDAVAAYRAALAAYPAGAEVPAAQAALARLAPAAASPKKGLTLAPTAH